MSDYLVITLIGLAVVVSVLIIYRFTLASSTKSKKLVTGKKRDRETVMKEAMRRLAQNPKDYKALLTIADIHYDDGDYEKASKAYATLVAATTTTGLDLDEYTINLKYGLCCLKLGLNEEAYKPLVVAKALQGSEFEVNYHLGYLEYRRHNYEKAVIALKQATNIKKNHAQAYQYLGQSFYYLKNYKEAVIALKMAMDINPDDKETLFFLAQCFSELGQTENAVRVFTQLQSDPELGTQSIVFASSLYIKTRQFEKAIESLEAGIRVPKISQDILLDMKYNLATAYTAVQNMEMAVRYFKEICAISPEYRDAPEQVKRLSEFNSNRHFQTYMLSSSSEFVNLCRNLTSHFFPKSRVKVLNVTVEKSEYIDIACEVSTSKWEDVILFRFVRSDGEVGEFLVRDLQIRLKEVHAGRGFCVTAGIFSTTAKQFVEARLIDLVEKDGLLKIMSSLR